MSSFFLRGKGSYRDKRRRSKTGKKVRPQGGTSVKVKSKELNEEIASDSEAENESSAAAKKSKYSFGRESDSDADHETPAEKRLRLAKEYLSQLESAVHEDEAAEEEHHAAIAHRLREDVMEQAGKLQRKVADQYSAPDADKIRFLKGHQLPVTCVAMTSDNRYLYSGAKDCTIIKCSVGHTLPFKSPVNSVGHFVFQGTSRVGGRWWYFRDIAVASRVSLDTLDTSLRWPLALTESFWLVVGRTRLSTCGV